MSLEATFFSSYPQLILACLVVLVAQTIYVLFGFGLGLIGVGLLAMFIQPLTNVVVLLLFIAIPAEIYVLCKSWKNISWRGIVAIVCGVAVGTVVGTMVLRYEEPDFILTILALFLMVSGTIFLLMAMARIMKPASASSSATKRYCRMASFLLPAKTSVSA